MKKSETASWTCRKAFFRRNDTYPASVICHVFAPSPETHFRDKTPFAPSKPALFVEGSNSMGLSTTVLGSAAAVVVVLDGASGFLAFPSGRGEGLRTEPAAQQQAAVMRVKSSARCVSLTSTSRPGGWGAR